MEVLHHSGGCVVRLTFPPVFIPAWGPTEAQYEVCTALKAHVHPHSSLQSGRTIWSRDRGKEGDRKCARVPSGQVSNLSMAREGGKGRKASGIEEIVQLILPATHGSQTLI